MTLVWTDEILISRTFADGKLDRLLGVCGGAHQLERRFGLDELGESATNGRFVVRDEHADSIDEDSSRLALKKTPRWRSGPILAAIAQISAPKG